VNLLDATEYWRTVEGFEGYYEVSSHGRVKALPRLGRLGEAIPTRILEQSIAPDGSRSVTLRKPTRKSTKRVSHLVLWAFLGFPAYKEIRVVYKDGAKANCRLDNLKWARKSVPKREPHHRMTSWGTRKRGSGARLP
jgi:hypothetical protein